VVVETAPDSLRLYFRYAAVQLRAQMQYPASFWMMTVSFFLGMALEFAGIVILFHRFGTLRGWTLPEIAMLYSIMGIGIALAEGIGRGFDTFPALIKSGDFDRLLLRPRSTVLQVLGTDMQLMRAGRLLQALVILAWAVRVLPIEWTLPKCALLLLAMMGATCVFGGLFVLQATFCFWTIEGLEIWNAVTYGGNETAQYPLTVYRPWFRRFFTWVVPLACANYLPLGAILGRPDPLGAPPAVQWCAPLVGILFLLACLRVWRLGVRHYTSTGS
jgi:ABC-2 type transport system permease protein